MLEIIKETTGVVVASRENVDDAIRWAQDHRHVHGMVHVVNDSRHTVATVWPDGDVERFDEVPAQPTVVLRLGPSYITMLENGVMVETTETLPDGQPDWSCAGECDHRGAGGQLGYTALYTALTAADRCARHSGLRIERVAA